LVTNNSSVTGWGATVRIDLLGPFQAEIDGKSIVPSAARPCQVLALLALNSEHLISKSALLEELWGHQPPTSATTLHTYIHQLRRRIDNVLGSDAPLNSRQTIVTCQMATRSAYTVAPRMSKSTSVWPKKARKPSNVATTRPRVG